MYAMNGPLRYALPPVVLVFAATLAGCHALEATAPITAGVVGLVLVSLAVLRKNIVAYAVGAAFEGYYQTARAMVERKEYDVVVGFSFGGAVTTELLRRGVLCANRKKALRVILLGPARQRISDVARYGWGPKVKARQMDCGWSCTAHSCVANVSRWHGS